MDPQAQKRIDRLRSRVEEVLGETYADIAFLDEGGMGAVFTGKHKRLGRTDAIKVLFSEGASGADALERFKGEWQTIAALGRCPFIISIYEADHDEERDLAWLAEEFIDGQSLKDRLLDGRLSRTEALRIAEQIASGLDYAHQRGIIHRDVKPANVLIDKTTDEAVLTDFGLARFMGDERLTQTHMAVGTLAYMSPESLRGADPSPAMDCYSFGVMLYELLTGSRPFDGPDLIQKHLQEAPADPRTLAPDLPPALCDLVMALLSKEPGERPSLKAVCQALTEGSLDKPSETDATIEIHKKTSKKASAEPKEQETRGGGSARIWIIAAVVAVLAVGGWLGRGAFTGSPEEDSTASSNMAGGDSVSSPDTASNFAAHGTSPESTLTAAADNEGTGSSAAGNDTETGSTGAGTLPDTRSGGEQTQTPAVAEPAESQPPPPPSTIYVQVGISGDLRREASRFKIWINGRDSGLTGPQLVTWDRPGNGRVTLSLRHAAFEFEPAETTLVLGARTDTLRLDFRPQRK